MSRSHRIYTLADLRRDQTLKRLPLAPSPPLVGVALDAPLVALAGAPAVQARPKPARPS